MTKGGGAGVGQLDEIVAEEKPYEEVFKDSKGANCKKCKGCFCGRKGINGCEHTSFKSGMPQILSNHWKGSFRMNPGPVEARSSLQISVVVRSCLKRPASLQS